jgi:hypothetical protein
MSWVDRVEARADSRASSRELGRRTRAVKAFSQPPFWSDGARVALSVSSTSRGDMESGGDGFEHYVHSFYKSNGIVFALNMARARVFAQMRFCFQRMREGREGELFGTSSLSILETPWPNGTTGEMLTTMALDESLAGNSFWTTADDQGRIGKASRDEDGRFVAHMRPDWCTLLISAPSGNYWNVDARVVGLVYKPPGMAQDPLILSRGEFVHYSPLPDPEARFRGMSWVTPIAREIFADEAFTTHKTAFLRNGATPNIVVKLSEDMEEDEFRAFVRLFKDEYEGPNNVGKTLFVAGAADVTPISVDFKALEMSESQGALETRMCAAAGVPAALAGISEGLKGSALNAGNFTATRRLFVDSTMRDLWGKAAPSVRPLCPAPGRDARNWYDARDIPFLRDDAKDEADTFNVLATGINQLIQAGYDPDAIVKAARARNVEGLIGNHSGLFSVQLQPIGTGAPAPPAPSPNGNAALVSPGGSNGNGR